MQARASKHYVEVLTGIKVHACVVAAALSSRPSAPSILHGSGSEPPPCTPAPCTGVHPPTLRHATPYHTQCTMPKVSGVVFKEQVAQLQYVPLEKAK